MPKPRILCIPRAPIFRLFIIYYFIVHFVRTAKKYLLQFIRIKRRRPLPFNAHCTSLHTAHSWRARTNTESTEHNCTLAHTYIQLTTILPISFHRKKLKDNSFRSFFFFFCFYSRIEMHSLALQSVCWAGCTAYYAPVILGGALLVRVACY